MKKNETIYIAAKGEEQPIEFICEGSIKAQYDWTISQLKSLKKEITSCMFDECEVIKTEIKCS